MSETDQGSTCTWKVDVVGFYFAQCGKVFTQETTWVEENSFIYCPFCGKRIIKIDIEEE